jgi:adenine-specific DNA glycosylase
LLVQAGKHYCLKQQPKCEACPLGALLPISIEQSVSKRALRKNKLSGAKTARRNRRSGS